MIKTITWYNLWKKLKKQPSSKTRGEKVIIIDRNGEKHECILEFTNNGSDFHKSKSKEAATFMCAEELRYYRKIIDIY